MLIALKTEKVQEIYVISRQSRVLWSDISS